MSNASNLLVDALTMRRLAFIRFLHTVAVEQSQHPEPAASASLLTFHDAVELFLYLAMVHLNVSKKEPTFIGYWELLDLPLKPDGLGQKEPMRRLNDLRGAMKHQGYLPASIEIETARVSTTAFFEENTPRVFKRTFASISMVDLVSRPDIREPLRQAETQRDAAQHEDAVERAAYAFARLLHHEGIGGGSAPRKVRLGSSFGDKISRNEERLAESHNALVDNVTVLRETVATIALGIDYRDYVRFKRLTPHITLLAHSEDYRAVWLSTRHISFEDLSFCIDFVLTNALRLQRP